MKKSFPQIFFLVIVFLVTAAFLGLIGGFIMSVFWAIVFAILFHNRYELFLKRFPGKPNLSAGLTLGFILLVVIVPLTIIGFAVVDEATQVYLKIEKSDFSIAEQIEDLQERIPVAQTALERIGLDYNKIKNSLIDVLTNGTKFMATSAVTISQNIFGFLINFSLMLYILFFFIRDGKRLVQELVWVVPIGDEQEWTLLRRFESVARATVKGSLLVALIQGAIGGVLFAIVGIPAAFLWGVIMVLASLLPIGSTIVWGPWAVAMFIQGNVGAGVALLVVGAGLIGLMDNLLRPRLVGQDTKMPDYLILLSTLGGLTWFGLSGFVIGPIIAALFITCWEMLGREYGEPYEEIVTEPTADALIEQAESKQSEADEISGTDID